MRHLLYSLGMSAFFLMTVLNLSNLFYPEEPTFAVIRHVVTAVAVWLLLAAIIYGRKQP